MILLVETNFDLELAYGQEEHASCRALVDLADRAAEKGNPTARPHESLRQ